MSKASTSHGEAANKAIHAFDPSSDNNQGTDDEEALENEENNS